MDNWSLKGPRLLVREEQSETDVADNQIKVKVTHSLISNFDAAVYAGDEETSYPVTLGRFATGIVTEVGKGCVGIRMSDTEHCRVYLDGVKGCGKCIACRKGRPEECLSPQVAGKDTDGYLRDIVVCEPKDVAILPDNIDNADAVCIEYVALAESVLDKMDLTAGSKVAILGCGLLGMVISQVAQYHKYIPIMIDYNPETLEFAKRCGICYAFAEDDTLMEKVDEATVGQLCDGAVLVLSDRPNPLDAVKVVAKNRAVAFAGFVVPSVNFDMREFITRGIRSFAVTNGYGYIGSALNIIANGAVNMDVFNREIISDADLAQLFETRAGGTRPPSKLTILKMVM
ncbi:MAG: alcohol dehydrogenase catalytic domain-containing protein [Clostridia bacterium]|nr:alcohol dehydrogenase catalytic domain-containing protein [Clostridia bacterium]